MQGQHWQNRNREEYIHVHVAQQGSDRRKLKIKGNNSDTQSVASLIDFNTCSSVTVSLVHLQKNIVISEFQSLDRFNIDDKTVKLLSMKHK